MLGTIYDILDKSESIDVKVSDKFIIIRGTRLEVKLEDKNQLRLTLVDTVDDRDEQYNEAILGMMNSLEQRRKDLAIIKQELKEITSRLDDEDLEESVEEALYGEAIDRRALKKHHEKEIKKLEAQTTVSVKYRIVKTGLTTVLPPGLILHPEILSHPICWCPHNKPESNVVEEVTPMVEEMSIVCAQHCAATGVGLKDYSWSKESTFSITAKTVDGKPRDTGGDKFLVESKEADIKYSVFDKKNGVYEVSYKARDVEVGKQFSMAVTLYGRHIRGSPFSVNCRPLLLEFSSTGNYTEDWLDEAVTKMSNIPRARLWLSLHDVHGTEVYSSTGITNCKWTQTHITSPGKQYYEDKHTNAVRLDNGDRLMITGKHAGNNGSHTSAYNSYSIIINAGWDTGKLGGYCKNPRRMIIAPNRGRTDSPYNIIPSNQISFNSAGFSQTKTVGPKFMGTFRIHYMPL